MESQRKLLETTLARLIDFIKAADAKIPPILAINTAMLGVFVSLIPKSAQWTLLMGILTVIAVVPILLSLISLCLATFPRTQGHKGSLLYFEGIKSHEPKKYLQKIQELSENELLEDLANQCHRNSEIASAKYSYIKFAMGSLFISIIPWLTLIFLIYYTKEY